MWYKVGVISVPKIRRKLNQAQYITTRFVWTFLWYQSLYPIRSRIMNFILYHYNTIKTGVLNSSISCMRVSMIVLSLQPLFYVWFPDWNVSILTQPVPYLEHFSVSGTSTCNPDRLKVAHLISKSISRQHFIACTLELAWCLLNMSFLSSFWLNVCL